MLRVEELNDLDELAGHRLLWNALLPQTRNAMFFQSLDWLEVYWRHFGRDQRLRVLMVYDDRQPIGILPLVVSSESTRVGSVRVLTYPLHDWGTFYGPIGPNPTATLLSGLQHVGRTRRDWEMLDLRWVDLAGCDHGRTEQAMCRAGFPAHKQAWAETAVIDMEGTWAQYWQGRTKKWRHNVNRCQRRLGELGEVTHVRYRPQGEAYGDGDPRYDLFDACCEVARRSWQASCTDGTTLCHEGVYQYLRETHAAAARCGSLDLNLLLLDGKPIAFAYNYHYHDRVHGLRMGFDPEFEAVGPGTVLQRMVLEDSFQRQDSYYDLGICYLDCKRPWQTATSFSYRFTHFPPTVSRVQLLRLKRWLQEKLYGDRYVVCAKLG